MVRMADGIIGTLPVDVIAWRVLTADTEGAVFPGGHHGEEEVSYRGFCSRIVGFCYSYYESGFG